MANAEQSQKMLTFEEAVAAYTEAGWEILSDGPAGVQMRAPKQMRALDKGAFAVGFILLFLAWPIGVILMLAAGIDYAMMKPETRFFPRPQAG